MKMPWGKHKGEDMEDLPTGYLLWLAENCDSEPIQSEAQNQLQLREGRGVPRGDER